MIGEHVELLLTQAAGDEMTPHERLIGDALEGDQSLFVREDEVEAALARRAAGPRSSVARRRAYEAPEAGVPRARACLDRRRLTNWCQAGS